MYGFVLMVNVGKYTSPMDVMGILGPGPIRLRLFFAVDSMVRDRAVDANLNQKACQSCQPGCIIPENERVLNGTVDGMGCRSKFLCLKSFRQCSDLR